MRRHGEGTIDHLPSGRWRLRISLADGTRRTILGDTEEEVESTRRGIVAEIRENNLAPVGGATLLALGPVWLDHREKVEKARNIRDDRRRWTRHVASAPFAAGPLRNVRPRDVRDWMGALRRKKTDCGTRTLSRSTRKHCLTLLRRFFAWALAQEYVTGNPAADVEPPRREPSTREAWTYLTPVEQERLLACVPEPHRWIVAFAIGTGLREQEQWALELVDVVVDGSDPHVWVRYGGPRHAPTKSGKPRKVPLFGLALEAARRWLAALPTYTVTSTHRNGHNPLGLMFPSRRGHHRQPKPPSASRGIAARHRGFEPLTYGSGDRVSSEGSRVVGTRPDQRLTSAAVEALRAVAAGAPDADELLRAVARAVVSAPHVRLAQRLLEGGPLASGIALCEMLGRVHVATERAS